MLDETMSRGSMAHKVIRKVNARLNFLYPKNEYLTPNLCLLLCNVLIFIFIMLAHCGILIFLKN